MKKITVLLFGICLLGISAYGLSTNSYYVQILINISIPFIYARVALVTALFAYVFVPSLRLYTTKTFIGAGGIFMVSIGILSVVSPTLLGYTNNYILFGDSLTLIEGGILAIIVSAELSAQRTRYIAHFFGRIHSVVTTEILAPTIQRGKQPIHSISKLPVASYRLLGGKATRIAVSSARL